MKFISKSVSAIICAALAAIIISCSNNTAINNSLLLAESIMHSKPDSALTILQNINAEELSDANRSLNALYALLLTQAEDKNRIDKTNDSLIDIAVNHYSESKDLYHKMLSHYYKARINLNAKNYSQSIIHLFKAESEAEKLGDNYHLGLIYQQFSDIHQLIYSNAEHLKYAKKSYDHFKIAGKQLYADWALYDLARAYTNADDYINGLNRAKQLIDTAIIRNNNALLVAGLRVAGTTSAAIKDIENTKYYFNRIKNINERFLKSNDYHHLGSAYLASGNIDSAKICVTKISLLDSTNKWLQYRLDSFLGNNKTALSNLETEVKKYNEVISKLSTQNIFATISDHYENEALMREKDLAHKRHNRSFIIITTAIILILAFIISVLYIRSQQARIEKYILLASNLQNDLYTAKDNTKDLQTAINNLFRQRFLDINAICDNLYPYKNKLNDNDKAYQQIKSLLPTTDTENETLMKVEQFINAYKDNLLIKFKEQFPKIKSIDYIIFIYTVIGFSYRTIGFLTNLDINNLYKRHHRLRAKIANSDAKDKDLFLSEIDKTSGN